MHRFKARLEIIGINPFVFVPVKILKELFKLAGKDKSPIPVRGTINDVPFKQTLVKYRGAWRLYVNTVMLKDSPKRIGEEVRISLTHDAVERTVSMHPKLHAVLQKNKPAQKVFNRLTPSLQKEIMRYIANLKTETAIEHNVTRAIRFLLGKERFIGRDKP